jgi:hypothetical protein
LFHELCGIAQVVSDQFHVLDADNSGMLDTKDVEQLR